MHRGFCALIAGLLIFGLIGCSLSDLVLGTTEVKRVKIAGDAMEPNFHDGQIVEIEEVPVSELQRGDVILFTVKDGKQYLKRLIGLPGETVESRAGKVYINDKVLDEPYIKEPAQRDFPARTVEVDRYFVLGDNRNNSSDSRNFGSIPSESILGHVKEPVSTPTSRTFLMQQVSMLPTIKEGELLLIEEVPASQLKRGDIIVFRSPGNQDVSLVKRLIGLPGETVEIRDNKVYIDGKVLDEPYIKEPMMAGDFPLVTLNSGEYYVMGDNRNNSMDSRHFGPIPGASILGRVKQSAR
jgi:signal peptidase I